MLEAVKKTKSAHSRSAFISRVAAITALSLVMQRYAFAAAYTYSDGGGTLTWSNSANWSPNGVPGNNDTASIIGGPGGFASPGYNVSYDYTGAAVTLSTLTISHSGLIIHGSDILTMGDSTSGLTVGYEYLGDSGNNGNGIFTQTGSVHTVTNYLELGVDSSDNGTYNLSGDGQLTVVNDALNVGVAGRGTFNQNGGYIYVGGYDTTATLALGSSSGTGIYNLNSGSVTVTGSETIGNGNSTPGTGTFTQTGGTNTVDDSLSLAANSSYSLSGTGNLSAGYETTYGTFTQTGGNHSVNATLDISSGSYTLSDIGVLNDGQYEYIGSQGNSATFTQTGGQHIVNGYLSLANSTGSTGTYLLQGGTLTVSQTETIGASGTGTFTHSAGTNSAQFLNVTTGSYTLSGTGTLSTSGGETITSLMTQNGGTNDSGTQNDISVGLEVNGTYQLNAGTLQAEGGELVTGGTMTQVGGTNTIGMEGEHTFMSIIGPVDGSTGTGTYSISNGAPLTVNGILSVGGLTVTIGDQTINEAFPAGVLNINSGNVVATDLIKIWNSPGSAINFSAGTITTAALEGSPSQFNWTGGTLNITAAAGMIIGSGGFFQTLTMNPGLTLNTSTLTIATGGTFNPNGGTTNYTGALILAGGTLLPGSSAYTNTGQISGYGSISGSGTGFTNTGLITVPTGNLNLSNTIALANSGTVTLLPGTSLQLSGAALANTGLVNLGGGTISGTSTLNNNSGGVVAGYGTISAPLANNAGSSLLVQTGTVNLTHVMTNSGTVNLAGPAATLMGAAITNNGVVRGDGVIKNSLTNSSSGEIRAENGTWLTISAIAAANAGKINLQGGTVEFTTALSNTGTITGRGELNADAGLTNTGKMLFSAGYTDLYGAVTNNNGGAITITGGGTTTFYNAFTNNTGGSVEISSDSIAAFESSVTGAGGFTGSGLKIFDGGTPSSVVTLASVVGDTVVEPGARLSVNSFNENAIDVEGNTTVHTGGTMNETNSLTIGSAGVLDLGNNSLAVSYTGQSPAALIRAYLTTAYNAGHWNGVGGIDSSSAGSNAGTSLGYSDNGTQVLIKYTWLGDANLDGMVNNADLALISPSGSTWQTGDFNYDGKVNGDDLALYMLGAAYGGNRNIATTLPEPAGVLLLLASGIFIRRNRRD